MEKIITPKTTPDIEAVFSRIFENAWGNPIKFNSAPASTDLNPNSWGYFGNNLYLKTSDGTAIKITGAAF